MSSTRACCANAGNRLARETELDGLSRYLPPVLGALGGNLPGEHGRGGISRGGDQCLGHRVAAQAGTWRQPPGPAPGWLSRTRPPRRAHSPTGSPGRRAWPACPYSRPSATRTCRCSTGVTAATPLTRVSSAPRSCAALNPDVAAERGGGGRGLATHTATAGQARHGNGRECHANPPPKTVSPSRTPDVRNFEVIRLQSVMMVQAGLAARGRQAEPGQRGGMTGPRSKARSAVHDG